MQIFPLFSKLAFFFVKHTQLSKMYFYLHIIGWWVSQEFQIIYYKVQISLQNEQPIC